MSAGDSIDATEREKTSDLRTAELAGIQHPQRIGRFAIVRLLGSGGFGLVYLAHDDQLNRPVALKVPHARRLLRPEDAEAYEAEARTVANLDHPHIVPVYDVGKTAEYPCYVVSKYIEGEDLATRLKRHRLSLAHAVELVATVSEALHYAHKQGFVHRDVKPGNILIDTTGQPFVVDFGVALREQSPTTIYRYGGTPAYMSPEQARGEGHRVDGRSDVFSLGVVLYELLVGRRPFHGSREELLDQIASAEPKPPRQIDDRIPRELERICHKALAKRASERYTTAWDLADDLRRYLHGTSDSQADAPPRAAEAALRDMGEAPLAGRSQPARPASDSKPLRIVPKGLRSFDRHDADFFLELLPGPRDREGLPESIRFWKSRIEDFGPDQAFSVGLIYGPSGCGKSSLVKAGLLPRLADTVTAVYLEATADETEPRLLASLHRHWPALREQRSLKDALASLRRGEGPPAGNKVLLVLDQFEQWLHVHQAREHSELAQALRQCDGQRVQCIVLVRDDFWMAVTRFLSELEIVLDQGHNVAAADLFDLHHARKVLTALGQAFGDLPEGSKISGPEQDFVRQAAEGMAQDGKVICVRLALFAEMMKDKPWTPAALRRVGGASGIGVTFLEETFSARTAKPRYRRHQSAARAVLQALLPESGANLKGHVRSFAELLELSGYADRPADFDELMRILDGEIRMVTPTDPDGAAESLDAAAGPAALDRGPRAGGCYQLTHDYLVPALRQWLTQKQRETRRGRTEIRLADRAQLWNDRRENEQLPSWGEFAAIHAFARRSQRTPTQRELMKSANRYYLSRWSAALLLAVLVIAVSIEVRGRTKSASLVARLLRAESSDVPEVLDELDSVRRWAGPRLRGMQPTSFKEDLHREAALLRLEGASRDQSHVRELAPRMSPTQAQIVAHELRPVYGQAESPLWEQLQSADAPNEVLSIATLISASDPDDPRWETPAREIAEQLVLLPPDEALRWIDNLLPVGRLVAPDLREIFTRLAHDDAEDSQRTYVAALALERFLRQDTAGLSRLLVDHARHAPEFHCLLGPLTASREASLAVVRDLARERWDQQAAGGAGWDEGATESGLLLVDRISNAILVEWMLGDKTTLCQRLRSGPDQTIRSTLIHRMALLEIPPAKVVSLLEAESSPDVRAALLLALGEYPRRIIPRKLAARMDPQIVRYRDALDAETHSAAQWLAAQWNIADPPPTSPAHGPAAAAWYTSGEGHTMIKVQGRLDRDFGLSATEVTVEQYRRFNPDYDSAYGLQLRQFLDPTQLERCPVIYISCYDAMQYCNWLTRKEGLDESQCCYEELGDGRLRPLPDHLGLRGYRLPDFAEWECGCLAGSTTPYSFGDSLRLLPHYAWYFSNSRSEGQHRARAVGTTKPNAFGLFDLYGNVWEWVTNVQRPGMPILCGGSCDNDPVDLRPVEREKHIALEERQIRVGFRIAQTVAPPQP